MSLAIGLAALLFLVVVLGTGWWLGDARGPGQREMQRRHQIEASEPRSCGPDFRIWP